LKDQTIGRPEENATTVVGETNTAPWWLFDHEPTWPVHGG
jgi:hypothetical protein